MTLFQSLKRLRFRIWHLLLTVALFAGLLWLYTQAGMVEAELEIQGVQLDNADSAEMQVIHSFDYRFLEPNHLYQSMQIVYLREPVRVEEPIEVGKRIRFRYRAKSIAWLERQDPNAIAIRLLGFAPRDINEIISDVQILETDE